MPPASQSSTAANDDRLTRMPQGLESIRPEENGIGNPKPRTVNHTAPRSSMVPVLDSTTWKPIHPLRVLIVEDLGLLCSACAAVVERLGFEVTTASTLDDARSLVATSHLDIVLLDLYVGEGYSLGLLEQLRERQPGATVLLMTSYASAAVSADVMRHNLGYLEKPFTIDELRSALKRASYRPTFAREMRYVREAVTGAGGIHLIADRSAVMRKVSRMAARVAFTDHPVLIAGPAGRDREDIARAIHRQGKTSSEPLLRFDCSTLSKNAADARRQFESCIRQLDSSGTIYFDEVGSLPLLWQDELLKAMQELVVLGGLKQQRARVIAGTTEDLTGIMERGRFRRSLLQRLSITKLTVPPLSERKCDLPLITCSILESIRMEDGLEYSLSDEAVALILNRDWHNGTRELEAAIRNACASAPDGMISAHNFSPEVTRSLSSNSHAEVLPRNKGDVEPDRVISLATLEKNALFDALKHTRGDKMLAARLLGIGKTTLYRKLKEHRISVEQQFAISEASIDGRSAA